MEDRMTSRAWRARFVGRGVVHPPFGRIIYLAPSFTIAPDELSGLTSAIVKVVRNGAVTRAE